MTGNASASTVTLFLCGDVMTGRGIDQILPHPCPPHIYEPALRSALEYVALAELAYGDVPRRAGPAYIWGVALDALDRRRPDARIINLETSVTTSEDAEPKGINYRMHPANVDTLTVASPDCAVLANNHVLDWGRAGLRETLDTLASVRIRVAGAGRSLREAEAPVCIELGAHRVIVFGVGGPDCGIPRHWAAGEDEPGVLRLEDYTADSVARIARLVHAVRRTGDVVVASVHWGGNWGYEIPTAHRRFAHALIDRAGVDVVHGHSSHHAKAIEVYRDRLILYGCGDFLNDYEGIHGPREYRDDLTFMYFPTLDAMTGALVSVELVPLRIRNFQMQHPTSEEREWLRRTVARECRRFGHRLGASADALTLEWTHAGTAS